MHHSAMPYADINERNAHMRRTYGVKYWTSEEFRKAEADRKAEWRRRKIEEDPTYLARQAERIRLYREAQRKKSKKKK